MGQKEDETGKKDGDHTSCTIPYDGNIDIFITVTPIDISRLLSFFVG